MNHLIHQQNKWFTVSLLSLLLMMFFYAANASGFTLTVVDENGPLGVPYRWQVEEDNTQTVTPNVHDINTISTGIHKSHAPLVAVGNSSDLSPLSNPTIINPAKKHFITVLPDSDHTLGGHAVAAGQTAVTVTTPAHPLPPAQISVVVFHDNQSLNIAQDFPIESGLSGFKVQVLDQLGGPMMTDTFGNAMGTTYNPDGTVKEMGSGIYTEDWSVTNPFGRTPDPVKHGRVLIKNLAPGKYGVRIVPMSGAKDYSGNTYDAPASDWIQTTTLEGTPGIDAWIRAGEPPFFGEFGAFNPHAFFGFTLPQKMTKPSPTGVFGTITGQAVRTHTTKAQTATENGGPVPQAWIGLNDLSSADEQVYAQPANPDGTFQIDKVPPGTYQLVLWDFPLDMVIGFRTVIIPSNGGTIDLGKVAYNDWFGHLYGSVFFDIDENGFRNNGEVGIPRQLVNLRLRDGTINSSTTTNDEGEYGFDEVFPFFKWIIVEVDYSRFKATGMTAVVDNGGALAPGALNVPQPQLDAAGNPINNPNTGDNLSRTETTPSPVLLEGMMLYADQFNTIDWGKKVYASGENGGIAGIVFYDTTRAEDDPRLNTGEPWQPGIPNVRVNLYKVVNNELDPVTGKPVSMTMVNTVATDSWEANFPTGCQGLDKTIGEFGLYIDCAEIIPYWNQIRPALFDGGYIFLDYYPGGIQVDAQGRPVLDINGDPIPVSNGEQPLSLPSGRYVVEVNPPAGYQLVKEEDKNVTFGDEFAPVTEMMPPACVGEDHLVPPELSLFPGEPGFYADEMRPLCNRKLVDVVSGKNTPSDFFLFTEVPKTSRIVGLVTDDLTIDPRPTSPRRGDKVGPAWLPVAIKDFLGNEIARTYTDEYGSYEALAPSTYTINTPCPTGVSPGMVQVCLNDPGTAANPEPFYNPKYTRVCLNFEMFPAKIVYTDTPVLPIGAMRNAPGLLNCGFPAGTPEILRVDGPENSGPYVDVTTGFKDITIQAVPGAGFGTAAGLVQLSYSDGTKQNLGVQSWADASIVARVPTNASTGQLTVIRSNGVATVMGITLHVRTASYNPTVRRVPAQFATIQAAIDGASPGDLILVAPGTYLENPIMYKPVKLQGYGAGSTIIDSLYQTQDAVTAWDAKVNGLITAGTVNLIPGTETTITLANGAGITVLASTTPGQDFNATNRKASIDGFKILGAINGGGIFVNAYAHYLEIANNRLESNQGDSAGGMRIGTPSIINATNDGYRSSFNDNIKIHNNHVTQNGAINGGGGISLFNGSDSYAVTDNYICGNFTPLYGGGIAHFGLSNNGLIQGNTILFNESFDEGGGIMIAGELPLDGGAILTPGSGNVVVNRNLIQANLAGDDGGGIRTLLTNGQDVETNPNNRNLWYQIDITNNMIVNNVSADAGAGIALDDSARINIIHNTVANNDSTATNIDAFTGGNPNISVPQPSGVVGGAHSIGLQDAFGIGVRQTFSNPILYNNIIWHNRSFYWDGTINGGTGGLLPAPGTPVYQDLGVLGTAGRLSPQYCILTSTAGYAATNRSSNPGFVSGYVNELQAAGTIGLLTVSFTPLSPGGNYHIAARNNDATTVYPVQVNTATRTLVALDFDIQSRTGQVDIGADEVSGGGPVVQAPGVVNSFTATRINTSTIRLTWTAVANADNYRLERQKQLFGIPLFWGLRSASIPPGTTVYNVTSAPQRAFVRYRYRIRAKNAAGSSAWIQSAFVQ